MGNLVPGRSNTEFDKDYETVFFDEIETLTSNEADRLNDSIKDLKHTIEVFQEQYAEGDFEVAPLIDMTAGSLSQAKKDLSVVLKKKNKPYFGRIIFDNDSIYIGRLGIRRDNTEILVALVSIQDVLLSHSATFSAVIPLSTS